VALGGGIWVSTVSVFTTSGVFIHGFNISFQKVNGDGSDPVFLNFIETVDDLFVVFEIVMELNIFGFIGFFDSFKSFTAFGLFVFTGSLLFGDLSETFEPSTIVVVTERVLVDNG
jgi:hypothetical protein